MNRFYIRIHCSFSQQVNNRCKSVIRKGKKHIFFYDNICNSAFMVKFWMRKRTSLYWFFIIFKNIWKIHKMSEIMNFLPRNNAVSFGKIEFFDEEFYQRFIHVFVKNKTGRFSFSSGFDAFFNFFYKAGSDVIIKVKFCIFGHLKRICFEIIIPEIGENVR